jgi:hypothetical protein
MSRQYNPAIAAYNSIKVDMTEEPKQKAFSGLLAPKNMPQNKEEDMSQPMARVAAHVKAIRKRRMEEDGS